MNFQEKKLYHQIHPAIIASLLIVRFVPLEKYKQSPFGLGTWPDFFKTLKVKPTDLAQTTIAICSPLNR